jgi:dUTP pyrophosphatase
MTIKFKKLSDKAVQPVRATNSGAGYNLTAAAVSTDINERGQVVLIYHTNLAVEIPEGYEGILRPVNSIDTKTLRMLGAPKVISGNIDDEVVVKFVSTTDVVPAVYKEGEHIAQLVINKIEDVEFIELIDTTEQSAGEGEQSLPENEDMSTNSDQPNEPSGDSNERVEEAQ